MGSANWTFSGFKNNNELDFLSEIPEIAKGIENLLLERKPIGKNRNGTIWGIHMLINLSM
jgi:hypothetical protein